MITQNQLKRHQLLKAEADESAKQLERSRKQILAQIGDGDSVEAGDRTVKVETRESRSFSYDGLVDIVGRKTTDFLKEQLKPKQAEILIITQV